MGKVARAAKRRWEESKHPRDGRGRFTDGEPSAAWVSKVDAQLKSRGLPSLQDQRITGARRRIAELHTGRASEMHTQRPAGGGQPQWHRLISDQIGAQVPPRRLAAADYKYNDKVEADSGRTGIVVGQGRGDSVKVMWTGSQTVNQIPASSLRKTDRQSSTTFRPSASTALTPGVSERRMGGMTESTTSEGGQKLTQAEVNQTTAAAATPSTHKVGDYVQLMPKSTDKISQPEVMKVVAVQEPIRPGQLRFYTLDDGMTYSERRVRTNDLRGDSEEQLRLRRQFMPVGPERAAITAELGRRDRERREKVYGKDSDAATREAQKKVYGPADLSRFEAKESDLPQIKPRNSGAGSGGAVTGGSTGVGSGGAVKVDRPGKKVAAKDLPTGWEIRNSGKTDYADKPMYEVYDGDGNHIVSLVKIDQVRQNSTIGTRSRVSSGYHREKGFRIMKPGSTVGADYYTYRTAGEAVRAAESKEEPGAAGKSVAGPDAGPPVSHPRVFHATTHAAKIRAGGFRISDDTGYQGARAYFGKGVYLHTGLSDANRYLEGERAYSSSSTEQVIAQARVTNPFIVQARPGDDQPRETMRRELIRQGIMTAAEKLTVEQFTARLKRRGYDAVEVRGAEGNDHLAGNQLVVFDPKMVELTRG